MPPVRISREKLSRAVAQGYQRTEVMRQNRKAYLNAHAGRYFSKGVVAGAVGEQPINLIHQAISIVRPNVVGAMPMCQIRTEKAELRPYSELLALAVNFTAKRLKFARTLNRAVVDAITGVGIIKTGLEDSQAYVEIDGRQWSPGEIFIKRVSPDRFVLDPKCRDLEESVFLGDIYSAPLEQLLESGLYDEDALRRAPTRSDSNDRGAATISHTDARSERYNLYDEVDLVDLYLPRQNVILTMCAPRGDADLPASDVLRVREHVGPRSAPGLAEKVGPYHVLGFEWAPDNPLPIPMAGVWWDLHEMTNRLMRKTLMQVEAMKRLLLYTRMAERDAENVVGAQDLEAVAVDDAHQFKDVQIGGLNDHIAEVVSFLIGQHSRATGNIEQLGGLHSDAGTATQAEILNQNMSVRVGDMQDHVGQFAATVYRDVGLFLHTDPLIELPLTRRVPGFGNVELTFSPETREGDFLDFHFEINHFSMRRRDPVQQARDIQDWLATSVAPMVEMAMATQGQFDAAAGIRITGERFGIAELDELWPDAKTVQKNAMLVQAGPQPQTARPNVARNDPPRPRTMRAGAEGRAPGFINAARGTRLRQLGETRP